MRPSWFDGLPPELLVAAVLVAVAVLLLSTVLIADARDARNSMPLSEWEARQLKRDQYRTERRRKLRALQVRLGLRRAS